MVDLFSSAMMLRYFLMGAIGGALLFLAYYIKQFLPIAAYAYPVARIRVMAGTMMRENKLRELIEAMNYRDVIASFEGTTYERFVAEKTDLEEIEQALSLNLAFDYKKIVSMSPRKAKRFFRIVSARYDIENIKRIIASKETGEKVGWLFPAPLSGAFLQKLKEASNIAEVIELLKATHYKELVKDLPPEATASEYGKMLDKYLYETILSRQQLGEAIQNAAVMGDEKNIKKIYGMLVDLLNIKIALRSINEGLPVEAIKSILIKNYHALNEKKLEALAESRNVLSAISVLEGTPYYAVLSDALREYSKNKRLCSLERALDEFYLQQVKAMFVQQPFGLTPMVSYLVLKENEIRNLKTILNGIKEGIPKERIKQIAIGV